MEEFENNETFENTETVEPAAETPTYERPHNPASQNKYVYAAPVYFRAQPAYGLMEVQGQNFLSKSPKTKKGLITFISILGFIGFIYLIAFVTQLAYLASGQGSVLDEAAAVNSSVVSVKEGNDFHFFGH